MKMRFVVSASFFALLSACGSAPSASSALLGEHSRQSGAFPTHPDLSVTPGAICQNADTYRYPEHIKYCERDVSSSLKKDIISQYDADFGYSIGRMDRQDFKIDHFVPLCMGGANDRTNLWPQHKSVYVKTDGIEMKLCQLLATGDIKQVDAIAQIKDIKFHLEKAAELEASIDAELARR